MSPQPRAAESVVGVCGVTAMTSNSVSIPSLLDGLFAKCFPIIIVIVIAIVIVTVTAIVTVTVVVVVIVVVVVVTTTTTTATATISL